MSEPAAATAKRQVVVRLFAVARDLAGAATVELALHADATIADLRLALVKRMPQLAVYGASLRFAIDNDYAEDATIIPAGAEIACIPPVSGG